MIKVKLKKYKISDGNRYTPNHYEILKTIDQMKQWCRDSFGPGYDKSTKKWHWQSRMEIEMVHEEISNSYFSNSFCHFPVFYFTSEEKASWFLIRWG